MVITAPINAQDLVVVSKQERWDCALTLRD